MDTFGLHFQGDLVGFQNKERIVFLGTPINDQIANLIVAQLLFLASEDNERDINAVFTGVSGAGALREVLARLDTRQQALIMGHAVPMPVVIHTRTYDTDFYAAMGYQDAADLRENRDDRVNLLRGEPETGID